MNASPNLFSFLKCAEGFRAVPYEDPPGSGKWSCGYGGQLTAKELEHWRGCTMSEAEAAAMLRERVALVETALNRLVKVPLEQREFDALVSFAYNVGIGGFRGSTLLREINAGNKTAAPAQIKRWHWSGGKPNVLDGRRAAEVSIWLNQPTPGYA